MCGDRTAGEVLVLRSVISYFSATRARAIRCTELLRKSTYLLERNRNTREVQLGREKTRSIAPTETPAPRSLITPIASSYQLVLNELSFSLDRLWGRERYKMGQVSRPVPTPSHTLLHHRFKLATTDRPHARRASPLFVAAGCNRTPLLVGGGWGPFSLKAGDLRWGR